MTRSQPIIRVNHLNKIIGFIWSPDQEAPLRNLSEEKIKAFYDAYLCLARFLKDSENLIEHRLSPGELLVFNNRRFLHGRNRFTSTNGSRHLQVNESKVCPRCFFFFNFMERKLGEGYKMDQN